MAEQDWDYWLSLYIHQYCVARGLRPNTIDAYHKSLQHFVAWCTVRRPQVGPDQLVAADVYAYLQYLKNERCNGNAALNRQAIVIRQFYRAMVAYGYLTPDENPMAHFQTPRKCPKKLPRYLSREEVRSLMDQPRTDTVLGIRDRALLQLLYSTGIRASECAGMCEEDVDLDEGWVRVQGKGGGERTIPLTSKCKQMLRVYREHRGWQSPTMPFFLSRLGRALSRNAIYERVRKYGRQARLNKRVTPHVMRHTFATHMIQSRVNLVALRDLLGHKLITSTQVYLHVSAEELRGAIERHPIKDLASEIAHLIPKHRLPFQDPPRRLIC